MSDEEVNMEGDAEPLESGKQGVCGWLMHRNMSNRCFKHDWLIMFTESKS